MKTRDQKYEEAMQRAKWAMNGYAKQSFKRTIDSARDLRDAAERLACRIGVRKKEDIPHFIVDFAIANFKGGQKNGI